VSVVLDLDVAGLTWAEAEAIEAACRKAGRWSVHARPRRRFGLPRRPELALDPTYGERSLVLEGSYTRAPFLPTDPELAGILADTLLEISDLLGRSFSLTVAEPGELVQHERQIDSDELASVLRASRVAPGTRYLVRPHVRRHFGRV
jgi:hypothetical protein